MSTKKVPSFDEIWAILERISISHEKFMAEQEEIKAEQERARIEREKARAEQEKARIEREKARVEQEEKARVEREKIDKQLAQIIAETNREMAQNSKKIAETNREMAQWSKEMDERLAKMSKETDERLAKISKETDRHIQKIGGRFNERWGHLVEALVKGKLPELLEKQGIKVNRVSPNVLASREQKDGSIKQQEFDVVASNNFQVVATEVKTTLTIKKIQEFLETLKYFKSYFPDHKNKKLYAAVAYLDSEDKAIRYAEAQGLFVVRAVGDSAKIINKAGFKPKVFA